jgi:O-acetyl-ADP-ribose deacetylase (regulator of RNase III)
MKFKIQYGNLVKEQSTFIVNASNTELILGSGVSKAFREHCGGSFFQQELYKIKEKIGKIVQGDVVLSNSGSAKNFQYALHVAVMNYTNDTQSPFPIYKQIQNSLNGIYKIVEEKALKESIKTPKVVIPLLGCGTGGLKKEKVFFYDSKYFHLIKN